MTYKKKSADLCQLMKKYFLKFTYLGSPGETPTPNLAEREPRLYAVELLGEA